MQPFNRIICVALVSLMSACASTQSSSPATASADEKSGRSLDITLPSIDGEDVTLTAQSDNDLFVLAFWATWCTPCQAELSKLDPIYQKLKDRGLQVLGISIDGPDTAAQVPAWARREGYTYPILQDRETEVLARFNPSGDIPFYVVLDAKGNVVKSHQGYVSGDMDELQRFLEERLP